MKWRSACLGFLVACPVPCSGAAVTRDSIGCLSCHEEVSPGIVADWRKSAHARITVRDALAKPRSRRRVSLTEAPTGLEPFAVGCAECHTLRPKEHKDTFEHNDSDVHVVVSPRDCAVCHPVEEEQFGRNLMSHAHRNLTGNVVYHTLGEATNGIQRFVEGKTVLEKPAEATELESCIFCHGSVLEVAGTVTRDTDMGEMVFPVLKGWPNQGVGRVNLDGSRGACSACHPRHRFSIATARKPYTCSECHKGPDVPAYSVYMVSKHGNIFSSEANDWNMDAVPWTVGVDFTAPTCATCHVSEVAAGAGDVLVKRTHQMNDRSEWRLFGLIYAHPHPRSADTTIIRNKAGLPLPTELTGEPVSEFLIDDTEREKRRETMKTVCRACHGSGWVAGRFAQLASVVEETNRQTLAATKIMLAAWEAGVANKEHLFDEGIEKKWTESWLFHANSVRFSSAMCGADYGVFANGRWFLARTIQDMLDLYEAKKRESHRSQ